MTEHVVINRFRCSTNTTLHTIRDSEGQKKFTDKDKLNQFVKTGLCLSRVITKPELRKHKY